MTPKNIEHAFNEVAAAACLVILELAAQLAAPDLESVILDHDERASINIDGGTIRLDIMPVAVISQEAATTLVAIRALSEIEQMATGLAQAVSERA